MPGQQPSVEFRIMPNGDGHWYWEVLTDRTVVARGVAATEPTACREASEAARKADLLSDKAALLSDKADLLNDN
jgi:hypothetical protein